MMTATETMSTVTCSDCDKGFCENLDHERTLKTEWGHFVTLDVRRLNDHGAAVIRCAMDLQHHLFTPADARELARRFLAAADAAEKGPVTK